MFITIVSKKIVLNLDKEVVCARILVNTFWQKTASRKLQAYVKQDKGEKVV